MDISDFIELVLFVALISLIDYVVRIRAKFAKKIDLSTYDNKSNNFTIIVPIFGSVSYLKNVKYLKRYKSKVILLTSSHENKSFLRALKRRQKKYGFRIAQMPVSPRQNGINNPWIIVRELFINHRSLIKTKYCLLMDADTFPEANINKLIGVTQKFNYDIASVGVLASNSEKLIEKLQQIEYTSSMRANYIYENSVSGAAMVGKTSKVSRIFRCHSAFPNGGDLERGMIAKGLRMKTGYVPFVFYTEVPSTPKAWFKQRRFWFAGGFRRNVINMHFYRYETPFYFFYNTILIYLFLPLRWLFLVTSFAVVPLMLSIYWFYAFIYFRDNWRPYYLLYPLYALFQVMFLVPVGIYTYFKRAFILKNPGIIRFRDAATLTYARKTQRLALNLSIMVTVQVVVAIGYVYLLIEKFNS